MSPMAYFPGTRVGVLPPCQFAVRRQFKRLREITLGYSAQMWDFNSLSR